MIEKEDRMTEAEDQEKGILRHRRSVDIQGGAIGIEIGRLWP